MPLPVALINYTDDEVRVEDLGLIIPPGSGTVLDITGLYLPEELRESGSLEELITVSGAVAISGSEGALEPVQAERYFEGSQLAEQNFTTEGIDLRSLRNTLVFAGDAVTVVSGEDDQRRQLFTVSMYPIVGEGNVTVTSGTDTITLSGTDTDTISDAIIAGHGVTVTSGTDTTLVDSFDEDDVDSITVSGTTITGSVIMEGGTNAWLDIDAPSNTITVNTFDDDDVDSITASGVTFTGSVNFDTAEGNTISLGIFMDEVTNTLTISGGQTIEQQKLAIGKIYQVSYGENGIATDKWLDVGHGNPSNRSPHIILWPTDLVGFSFSNRNDGIDIDVELWVASKTEGAAAILVKTWELRNMRTWHTTSVLDAEDYAITFNPGDKLGMYIRDAGQVPSTKTQDPVCNLYLQIYAGFDDTGFEDYTGDFVS